MTGGCRAGKGRGGGGRPRRWAGRAERLAAAEEECLQHRGQGLQKRSTLEALA